MKPEDVYICLDLWEDVPLVAAVPKEEFDTHNRMDGNNDGSLANMMNDYDLVEESDGFFSRYDPTDTIESIRKRLLAAGFQESEAFMKWLGDHKMK